MNYASTRDSLVAAVNTYMAANQAAVPVFYENAVIPDLDNVPAPLLRVVVEFHSATQADISVTPVTRIGGTLSLVVLDREGEGTRASLAIGDGLAAALAYKNLSGVQTSSLYPGHSETHDGWHMQEFLIDFWTHSTA